MNKNIIRFLRKLNNLSMQQLADSINTTKQTISKWENGKVANISDENLKALEDVFDEPVYMLIHKELTPELEQELEHRKNLREVNKYTEKVQQSKVRRKAHGVDENLYYLRALGKSQSNDIDLKIMSNEEVGITIIRNLIRKNVSTNYKIYRLLEILDRVSDNCKIDYSMMTEEEVQLHALLKLALDLSKKIE
ncbi:MAG: helix-turn-helix transcriptional regulator [Clostridiales bacterium]|jgi:transcriptional regulator with XRE-family HTH domain|nr:helix-turn-helix transcriptional regulator [Clostridiales bacterium]